MTFDIRKMLTSEQAAARIQRTDRWLRNMRRQRRGPPFYRFGLTPLYDPREVDRWLREQVQLQPTTEQKRRG